MKTPLLLATGNAHKVGEFALLLHGLPFDVLSAQTIGGMPPVEESGTTFEANAEIKARALAWKFTNPPPDRAASANAPTIPYILSDDSGLEVDTLNGRPGVYSARYAGTDGDHPANNRKLLRELEGIPLEQRTARFVCVLCLIDPSGKATFCRGTCEGHIALQPSGQRGFGYDPLFIPTGYSQPFAELGDHIKNNLSHRAKAVHALHQIFRTN